MTTTWEVVKTEINAEKKHVSIKEVIDGVDGKTYSVSVHASDSDNSIRKKLKTEINADRALTTANEAFKTLVVTALENFEDYLNS